MHARYESIILVINKQGLKTAFNIYNSLSRTGKNPLLLTTDDFSVPDKIYSVRRLQFYRDSSQIDYFKIKQEASDIFFSLGNKEISGSLTLRNLTMYKGVSLWDLSVRNVFADLLSILYDFNMAEAALDFEKPSEVHIINNGDNLAKIFELIAKKRQIHLFIHSMPGRRMLCINKFCYMPVFFARKIKRFFVSVYFLVNNLIKSGKLKKKYKVIFFTPVKRAFDSMLPVILKYNSEERLVIDSFLSGCSEKMKENGIFYTDFLGYKLYSLFDGPALKNIRKMINKNKNFYRELSYKGVPIGVMLDRTFDKLAGEIFFNNMENIDIIKKIFASHKTEAIVVVYYSVDIAMVARTISIPTLAIQNGFIDELRCFGLIINDAVTVDGPYWKQHLLKKQDINPERIRVTGPVKFDVVSNGRFKASDYDSATNAAKPQKIVIFATTPGTVFPMGFIEYEKTVHFKKICSAMANIKGAHLIIKSHTNERDTAIYKNIAEQAGLEDYSIVKDVDMLKLLRDCDLLIAYTSTVGYEAVLLDKNIISLSGASDDMWDFKRYNAAIIIDNFEMIESHIRNALYDPETISMLKKGREEYLREHAYKLDGHAADRVKEVIDDFVNT